MERWIVTLGLTALAVFVLAAPRLSSSLVGLAPLRAPSVERIDEPTAYDERAAPRFLATRDHLELVLEEDTTVGAVLRRYPMPAEHLRRQIGEQIGFANPPDGHALAAGTTLVLRLTPPA